MKRRRTWLITTASIAAAWALLAGALFALNRAEPTPAEVTAFLQSTPWNTLSADERRAALDELADRVNRLPPDARFDPTLGEALRDRFAQLAPDEQQRYLDQTLPRGFEQMMQAINAMPRDERQRLVDRALQDMQSEFNRDPDEAPDDAIVQQFINEGMRSYLRDASAETKLDLQPLIQQIQTELQSPRNRGFGPPR
ncbi:MAG: hypothetical protein AAF797_08005 [Planctomycetota bacterium]